MAHAASPHCARPVGSIRQREETALEQAGPKRARFSDALLHHTFTLVEANGAKAQVGLQCEAAAKVPYLHTLITTDVGSVTGAPQVSLPDGCSIAACVSLLHWAQSQVGSANICIQFNADTLDEALALARTADFLLCGEAMPAVLALCRGLLDSPEAAQRFLAITVADATACELQAQLRGSKLSRAVSYEKMKQMLESFRTPGRMASLPAQHKLLTQWLVEGSRSAEEVEGVMRELSRPASLFVSERLEVPGKGVVEVYKLITGGRQLLEQLSTVAASRPAFFLKPITEALLSRDKGPIVDLRWVKQNIETVKQNVGSIELDAVLKSTNVEHRYDSASVSTFLSALASGYLAKSSVSVDEVKVLFRGICRLGGHESLVALAKRCSFGSDEDVSQVLLATVMPSSRNAGRTTLSHVGCGVCALLNHLSSPSALGPAMSILAKQRGWHAVFTVEALSTLKLPLRCTVIAELVPVLGYLSGSVRQWIADKVDKDEL